MTHPQTRPWSLRVRDGVVLAADAGGDPAGPPVVFLHGGGQTRHSWGDAADRLAADGFSVLNLDLRGHGDSGWSPDGAYGLDVYLADLLEVLATLGRPAGLVGASLGGLTSLLAAGERHAGIGALVLVDIVPNIEPEGAQAIADFMRSRPDGFESLAQAAEAVAAYLPHRRKPADPEGLRKNLRLREDGRWHWHWDPRMLSGERRMDPLVQIPRLEAAARGVEAPTLLVRGALSRVVSADGVDQFRRLIPHAEFVNIADADHMVAGDRNDAFGAPLVDFLTRTLLPA